jgi:hypothetical protein
MFQLNAALVCVVELTNGNPYCGETREECRGTRTVWYSSPAKTSRCILRSVDRSLFRHSSLFFGKIPISNLRRIVRIGQAQLRGAREIVDLAEVEKANYDISGGVEA